MTTIAFKDGVIAGDTCASSNGVMVGFASKIFRTDDGRVGGFSGDLDCLEKVKSLINVGILGLDEKSEFSAFVTSGNGIFEYYGSCETPTIIRASCFAIGSGREFAYGAMAAGASAKKAVKISALYDSATNNKVETLTLGA